MCVAPASQHLGCSAAGWLIGAYCTTTLSKGVHLLSHVIQPRGCCDVPLCLCRADGCGMGVGEASYREQMEVRPEAQDHLGVVFFPYFLISRFQTYSPFV
jgi:hypothetical protein